MRGDATLRAEARALMDELLDAARRLGHAIPDSFADWQIERSFAFGGYRPSSLIDYELGRPVEVEAIWGEPLRQDLAAGAKMARLAMLHAVIRHVAERRAAARSVCSRGFPGPAIALLKIAGTGKSRLRNSGRALHGA